MVQVLADLTTFRGSEPAHTSWMISTTSFLSGKPPVWSLLCISLSSTLTSKAPLLPTFPFTTASRTQLSVPASVAAISSFTYWEFSPVSSTGGPSCGWRSLRSRSTLCGLKSTSFLPVSLYCWPVVLVVRWLDCFYLMSWDVRSYLGLGLGQMISPTWTRDLINLI